MALSYCLKKRYKRREKKEREERKKEEKREHFLGFWNAFLFSFIHSVFSIHFDKASAARAALLLHDVPAGLDLVLCAE